MWVGGVCDDDVQIESFVHQPQKRGQEKVMDDDGDAATNLRQMSLVDAAHENDLTKSWKTKKKKEKKTENGKI